MHLLERIIERIVERKYKIASRIGRIRPRQKSKKARPWAVDHCQGPAKT